MWSACCCWCCCLTVIGWYKCLRSNSTTYHKTACTTSLRSSMYTMYISNSDTRVRNIHCPLLLFTYSLYIFCLYSVWVQIYAQGSTPSTGPPFKGQLLTGCWNYSYCHGLDHWHLDVDWLPAGQNSCWCSKLVAWGSWGWILFAGSPFWWSMDPQGCLIGHLRGPDLKMSIVRIGTHWESLGEQFGRNFP